METATAATVAATTNAAALISVVGASQRCGAEFLRDFLGRMGVGGPPKHPQTDYLVGGLEHDFYDFPILSIYWECHHPN